jgi:ATP-dependent Clp protease ATP-binding subunit ClpA
MALDEYSFDVTDMIGTNNPPELTTFDRMSLFRHLVSVSSWIDKNYLATLKTPPAISHEPTPEIGVSVNGSTLTIEFSGPVTQNMLLPKFSPAKIEKHLRRTVIGQSLAIETLVQSIKLHEAKLKDPMKPIGVFLFAGHTGVGKTELARQLSVAAKIPMKRFDMSEYKEHHEYAKLIGSPPGYIGYGEGGQLTNFVKQNPACVVVFDEVDKANSDIMDLLLQITEEGTLTDGQGRVVSFAQAIVILTSNVGSREAARHPVGFSTGGGYLLQSAARTFESAIKNYFRPELLGRLTTVVFNPLAPESIAKITALELKKLAARFPGRLRIAPSARRQLIRDSDTARYGARDIKRVIDRDLARPLADFILQHQASGETVITVTYREKDKYTFSST